MPDNEPRKKADYHLLVERLVAGDKEGEPGILALVTGLFLVVATVAYCINAATFTYITWRICYQCALSGLMGLSVYHYRAPGRLIKNTISVMLGVGCLEKIVYLAGFLGLVVESANLWGLPFGCGIAFFWGVFGLAILAKGSAWYHKNSTLQLKNYVAVLTIVFLASTMLIAVVPLRYVYFERLSPSQYTESPGPGINVVLGGDEITLYSYPGAAGTTGATGTVCFYLPDNVAVSFAHRVGVHQGAGTAMLQKELVHSVRIVADSIAGVVLKGIPLPENRSVIPLGGATDITIGGRAVVYPPDSGPYEVVVRAIGNFGGPTYIELEPTKQSNTVKHGQSGSPVVQNGVIIAFVARGPLFSSYFHAIVAADLYQNLKPYLDGD